MRTTHARRRTLPLTFQSIHSAERIRTPTKLKSLAHTNNESSRTGRGSSKHDSHRISKLKNNHTSPSPSSVLADNLAGQLDQYRNSVHDTITKDFDKVEKNLLSSLEELSVDLDNHIAELTGIEEPLKNPLDTETLSIVKDGHEKPQEVLLRDQVSAFRKLREDKEEVLRKLWEDWENVQLQLIGLAAEVLGQDALTFAQVRDEDLKAGQKENLQNTLMPAQRLFDENGKHHESLERDLGYFEESIGQIANKTEKAVVDMQQQYNSQKSKLFKGLHRHIELLAAL